MSAPMRVRDITQEAVVTVPDPITLRGAVASVSLSHPDDCGCDVCRAASGDVDAFIRVAYATTRLQARRALDTTIDTREAT